MNKEEYIISDEEIERIKLALADGRTWQIPDGKHTKEEILEFILGVAEKVKGEV